MKLFNNDFSLTTILLVIMIVIYLIVIIAYRTYLINLNKDVNKFYKIDLKAGNRLQATKLKEEYKTRVNHMSFACGVIILVTYAVPAIPAMILASLFLLTFFGMMFFINTDSLKKVREAKLEKAKKLK